MTIAQFIPLAIQTSMALIMFCVALNANPRDVTVLLRNPGLLARSLLAMNVIMPLFAVAIALLFELNPVIEIALIATALSPVPPILPNKQIKAGGTYSYIIGVLAVTALFSIVFVPAAAEILGRVFDRPVHVSAGAVAGIVAISMLAPLIAGVVFNSAAPRLSKRITRPLPVFAIVLLVVAFVPVLFMEWRTIVSLIGDFTLVVIAVFVLAGLAVGHLLGGPGPDDRTVLALATATRHPAVALAIVHDLPDRRAALAAILLVLIFGAIVSAPYVKRRGRVHKQQAGSVHGAGAEPDSGMRRGR